MTVTLPHLCRIILVSAGFFGLSISELQGQTTKERPHILVILADDMGFSDIGCYGSEIKTPNLDALAAKGLRFTQFYNTGRCCPTRACLLTGLYPHQAGVGHMMEDHGLKFPGYRGNLNQSCLTMGEMLRPAGYRTYAVGKWHVTPFTAPAGPKDNWPLNRGFDRFYGTIHGAGSYYDPSSLVRDNTMISPYADAEYHPARYYYTDAIGHEAVRFITDHARAKSGKPLFMYVAFTAAHWPMHALPEDRAKYSGKYDDGYEPIRKARLAKAVRLGLVDGTQGMAPPEGDWSTVANKRWESACMETYAAMIDRLDQNIGAIVQSLRDQGMLDNTLILFMQDNGGCAEPMGRSPSTNHPNMVRPGKPTFPAMKPGDFAARGSVPSQTRDGFPVRMGDKVMPGDADTYVAYGRNWAHVSNTPFREYKHWVHEGGISSPLIAHWPAMITDHGALRRQPCHLIDIAATCVDLAQARYPARIGERNITPLAGMSLRGVFANQALNRDLYWEHEGNRALRFGDWKIVAKGPAAPWELYNIAQDRTEAHDRAATETQKMKELISRWENWAGKANVLPWIWKPAYQPAQP